MLSELPFLCIAGATLAAAAAAMSLRNLVHCALCAAVAFAGLGALYLQLNAEFAGLAQLMVYVGAVAILIVFAILLTRGDEARQPVSFGLPGLAAAALVTAGLILPVITSPSMMRPPVSNPAATVRDIGAQLMTRFVVPLEALGALLTAALIGAVIVAVRDAPAAPPKPQPAARARELAPTP